MTNNRTTTCAQCHRLLMKGHEDANGLCVFCNGTEQAPPLDVGPPIAFYHANDNSEIEVVEMPPNDAPSWWNVKAGKARIQKPKPQAPCAFCGGMTSAGRFCEREVCRAARLDGDAPRAAVDAEWTTKAEGTRKIRLMEGAHLMNSLRLMVGRIVHDDPDVGETDVFANLLREAQWRGYLTGDDPPPGCPEKAKRPAAWTEDQCAALSTTLGYDVRPGLAAIRAYRTAVADPVATVRHALAQTRRQRTIGFDDPPPHDPSPGAMGKRRIKL